DGPVPRAVPAPAWSAVRLTAVVSKSPVPASSTRTTRFTAAAASSAPRGMPPSPGADESDPAAGRTRISIGRLVSPEAEPTARKLAGALPASAGPTAGAVPVGFANAPLAPGRAAPAEVPPAWVPASLPASGAVFAGPGAGGA